MYGVRVSNLPILVNIMELYYSIMGVNGAGMFGISSPWRRIGHCGQGMKSRKEKQGQVMQSVHCFSQARLPLLLGLGMTWDMGWLISWLRDPSPRTPFPSPADEYITYSLHIKF